MQVDQTEKPEVLVPLFEAWIDKCSVEDFGFTVTLEGVMKDLRAWLEQYPSAMFISRHKGEIVGLIVVVALDNFLSKSPIAIEKYWYGQGGLELFTAAKEWAKQQGCGHFIASASNLAGTRHDRIKKLCENMGMKLFETAYIVEVQQ